MTGACGRVEHKPPSQEIQGAVIVATNFYSTFCTESRWLICSGWIDGAEARPAIVRATECFLTVCQKHHEYASLLLVVSFCHAHQRTFTLRNENCSAASSSILRNTIHQFGLRPDNLRISGLAQNLYLEIQISLSICAVTKNTSVHIAEKKTFSIGDLADLLIISVEVIRVYDRERPILPYRRDSKHRRYTQSDIERIRCIRKMINDEKIGIAGTKSILDLFPKPAINLPIELHESDVAKQDASGFYCFGKFAR